MGGGGGGALNKLFPGYKDKIWMKVPVQWRQQMIQHWNKSYEKQVYSESVALNRTFQARNQLVLDRLKPSGAYRLPAVDYKRQLSRGTLVEGADFYLPTAQEQQRLARHFEPYSEQEQEERRKFRFQSISVYLAVALGASFVHDYFYQRRPVAWCLEKEPPHPPSYPFWFKSLFHSHDIPSVRRGYEVYRK
ncbi:cytochrome c1, heme protein, partial [Toxoplasma gondii GAB2-2007-GAL-DOM2]